jgi:hypothetical protein
MANILHRILIKATPEKVYPSFATIEGLKEWWTRFITADNDIAAGAILRFRFGNSGPDMKVKNIIPGKRVEWECVDGPEDWIGTKIFFDLERHGDKSILHFGQTGWKNENDFYMHCNCRWAYFMLSIKSLIETGHGTPYPEALEI